MSGLKNGPRANGAFLRIIECAADDKKKEIAEKSVNDGYTALTVSETCDTVIRYFLQFQKSSLETFSTTSHESPVWRGVFLFQRYNPSTPPDHVSIMIPILISEKLQAQEGVILEVGCPIYVDEKATLRLNGSGYLISINIGFRKQAQVVHTS